MADTPAALEVSESEPSAAARVVKFANPLIVCDGKESSESKSSEPSGNTIVSNPIAKYVPLGHSYGTTYHRNETPLGQSYKCRFCGHTYAYMSTLKAHERVHGTECPYVCGKCGDSFRYSSELQAHMLGHNDKKTYKCKCGRGFFTWSDLLNHKHPGEDDEEGEDSTPLAPAGNPPGVFLFSEYTDGYNPKNYRRQTTQEPVRPPPDLRRRPYICQYCTKNYADASELKFHLYSHRGEPAFKLTVKSAYLSTYTG